MISYITWLIWCRFHVWYTVTPLLPISQLSSENTRRIVLHTIYLHPQHGHQSHNQSTSGSNYFQLIWWCNLYGVDPFICSRYRDSVIVSFCCWINFVYSSSVQVFYKIRYICCVMLQGEATSIGQSDTGSAGSPQRTPSRRWPCANTLHFSSKDSQQVADYFNWCYLHSSRSRRLIRNLYLVFFATLGIINLIIK